MPLYKVALRKAIGAPFTRKWSNTYYVDRVDLAAAAEAALLLWTEGERLFHSEGVYCYERYINLVGDPPGSPGNVFGMGSGIQRGALTGWNPAQALPLFNVVRVDFGVLGSRPSRKFYRLGLQETSIENGQLLAAYNTLITDTCGNMAAASYTVDVDGESWVSAVVKGITSRRLGRDSAVDVPVGPAFG